MDDSDANKHFIELRSVFCKNGPLTHSLALDIKGN